MLVSVERQNNTPLVNPQEVKRAYQLLTIPGQVVEIRALEASLDPHSRFTRTLGGYFDNINDLLKSISTIRSAMGIYITLHPCHPDILHRAKNKLVEQKKDFSTPDKYITGYQRLAIDCDPERVSGISSTEEEHEKALAMCRKIREALREQGWPEPVLADSGNGGHLLYRIDLPTSDAQLVKRTLEGLQQFNEDDVHVDLTLFNPSRIIKLYGTLACKGDNTEERPHRLSRILEAPDALQIVSREQLEAIATPAEPVVKPKETYQPSSNGHKNYQYTRESFTLENFIAKHGIRVKSSSPYNGGTRYLLEACAWDPSHTDNSACLYDMPNGLGASCSHHSCQGKHWKDFRLVYEANAYDRRDSTDWKSKSYGPTPSEEAAYYNDEPKQPSLDTVWQRLGENEWGDALLFSEIFQDRIVYDASNKEWYQWNEHYWKLDGTNYVRQLVSGHLGSVYMKAAAEVNVNWAALESEISRLPKGSDKIEVLKAKQDELNAQMEALKKRCYALRGAKRCLAVLGFAQTDPRMVVTGECWDKDKWALPVLNGVIDLRTGFIRDGKPKDYIRTVAPIEWTGLNTRCPRFDKFLQEIFEDREPKERQELIAFLLRLLGYAITGLSERAIFPILYGKEGRNGKDTLLALIKSILGPLAGAVSNDLFIDSKASRSAGSATPHVCDLQGKRIVWGSETKQGDKLNVAQVKLFTGGGDLSTRQLHGRQYSFSPTHTLLLMTNHRPHADADEEAFWARACLIEFKMRFLAPDEVKEQYDRAQDEILKETLMGELSGILASLVKGCLDYQKQGFKQPASVRMATAEYRKSEDQLQQFVDDCCCTGEKYFVKADQIYAAYKNWCFKNQHSAMNNTLFGEKFGNRFKRERKKYGKVYLGVGIIDFSTLDTSNNNDEGVYPYTPGVYPTGGYTPSPEAAPEAAPEGSQETMGVYGVYQNEVLALIHPRESGLVPKVEKCIHPIHPDQSNKCINQPVEPMEGMVYSSSGVYTHLGNDVQPLVECATQYDGYLIGAHNPSTYAEEVGFDATGNVWCSKCLAHSQLMEIGEELGYPEIKNGNKPKDIFVKAGQIKWLECATKWGHVYVQNALMIVQQNRI